MLRIKRHFRMSHRKIIANLSTDAVHIEQTTSKFRCYGHLKDLFTCFSLALRGITWYYVCLNCMKSCMDLC